MKKEKINQAIFTSFFIGVSFTSSNSILWRLIESNFGNEGIIFISPILWTVFLFLGLYMLGDYSYNPVSWNRLFINKYKIKSWKSVKNFFNPINASAALMLYFRKTKFSRKLSRKLSKFFR